MLRYISIQNVLYDRLQYDVYRTGIFGEKSFIYSFMLVLFYSNTNLAFYINMIIYPKDNNYMKLRVEAGLNGKMQPKIVIFHVRKLAIILK